MLNNNHLSVKSQQSNLDILNKIMDTIYSVTNLLITTKENKFKEFDEIKLDEYLDNVFGNFADLIELYKNEINE